MRELRCSFCGGRRTDSGKLISSPSPDPLRSYICDQCIMRLAVDDPDGGEAECTFCNARRVGHRSERSTARICVHCLATCAFILKD